MLPVPSKGDPNKAKNGTSLKGNVEPFGSILEETPKVTLATRGTVLGKMGGTVRVKFPKRAAKLLRMERKAKSEASACTRYKRSKRAQNHYIRVVEKIRLYTVKTGDLVT